MKQTKRMLAVLLALLMLPALGANVFAEDAPTVVASGDCGADGDDLTWTLTSDGVLRITGEGAMADYTQSGDAPWQLYYTARQNENDLVLAKALGYDTVDDARNAFLSGALTEEQILPVMEQLQAEGRMIDMNDVLRTVIVGEGVTAIGADAFFLCPATSISLPDSLRSIGTMAMERARFTELQLPENLNSIGECSFAGLKVNELVIPASVTNIHECAFLDMFNMKTLTFLNDAYDVGSLLLPTYMHRGLKSYDYDSYEAYCADNPVYRQMGNSPINNHFDDDETGNLPIVSWLTIRSACTSQILTTAARAGIKTEAIHAWSNWFVDEAEMDRPARRIRTCSVCRQTEAEELSFDDCSWTPLPTSPDGLEDGTYYIDFTKFTDMAVEPPEDTALWLSMYNSGEYFFDEDKLVFKETLTVPAAVSASGEDETVTLTDFIENDGLEIFGVCLREAGARWYPVAKTTEGLQSGDWYIDLSAADAATRERLSACDIYVNPNGRLEKYLVVPAEFRTLDYTGDFFPLMTKWLELIGPYMGRDDFEPDPYYFWPDVCPVRQYVAPEETNWIALPYATEGLSEGDWYLDLDAFMEMIGRGKSAAEKAEVRAMIEQHVTFSYNPGGEQLVYKYAYTDLPGEDGVPVSGTVVLPLDLTLGREDAFPYDYNALRQCVLQYHAPADPDTEQQTDGNGGWFQTNIIGRLKSAISAILSFFRRLFNLMK